MIITLMMKVLVLMFGVSLVSSNDVVTWEYLPLPSQDNPWGLESQLGDILPKYTTVFGIPVFGGAEVTVRRSACDTISSWLCYIFVGPRVPDWCLSAGRVVGQ